MRAVAGSKNRAETGRRWSFTVSFHPFPTPYLSIPWKEICTGLEWTVPILCVEGPVDFICSLGSRAKCVDLRCSQAQPLTGRVGHIPQGPYFLYGGWASACPREDTRDKNISLAYLTGGPEPQADGGGKILESVRHCESIGHRTQLVRCWHVQTGCRKGKGPLILSLVIP